MIQFDEHIFQMGWFNHQPDMFVIMVISIISKKDYPHDINGVGVGLTQRWHQGRPT